ncbi:phosphatase PAP2 family protein [Gluconacetobacter sacchari]|uniref:phosphatase PAP2 family protein n=1 Tax=Gluconacetobacter sacchari TaxID=92759 RepID=UPI0039B6489B
MLTVFLTDLADQDVLLPVEALVLLALLALRRWRVALAWAVVMASGSVLTLVLKLALEACGPTPDRVLYSPSGHTMAGTMVYGCLLAMAGLRLPVVIGGAGAIACVLAWSRLALGAHTLVEVVVGGVLGVAMVCLFRRLAGPGAAMSGRTVRVLSVVVIGLIAVCHGHRSTVEIAIQHVSRFDLGPLLCRAAPGAPVYGHAVSSAALAMPSPSSSGRSVSSSGRQRPTALR